MNWLPYAQIPITILALWLFTAYMTRSFPVPQGKRICLVIAHPDDEAMFFAPMILSLMREGLGNQLVILCFSSGDADGLGETRKKELVKSAMLLGVRREECVVVLEDERFKDGMGEVWDAKQVATLLTNYFAPKLGKEDGAPPETSIDVLITFDKGGVSGHSNHISLYHGSLAFMRGLMQGRSGWECPVKMYTLTTTNIVRKYSSVLDSVVTILGSLFQRREGGAFPTPLLAVSLPGDVRKAQLAMTTAHKSQMRWFRWGWIGVSRYMVINDLQRVKGF